MIDRRCRARRKMHSAARRRLRRKKELACKFSERTNEREQSRNACNSLGTPIKATHILFRADKFYRLISPTRFAYFLLQLAESSLQAVKRNASSSNMSTFPLDDFFNLSAKLLCEYSTQFQYFAYYYF